MEESVLLEQYLAEKGNQLLKYISTVPHRGATFITPKGLYVWAKNIDHPGLIDLIGIDNEDEESIIDAKGWIRCDSGLSFSVNNLPASFVELPEKEITSEQYNALLDWMIKCCSGFEFQISVTNGEFNSYDMDYYGPEDLIKIIKYYYKQGVLKEDLNALNEMLLEDNRTTLTAKSRNQGQYKDQSRGKNRFERKKYSKVANVAKAFNQIDMNDITELQRRKIMLLGNNNLNNLVDKMIKTKGLPAKLDSITLIASREGETEIVVRLLISKSNINKIVKTYIYITEDIFNLGGFEYIDEELGLDNRKISTDDLIKLRALRVVYNVIKNISAADGTSEPVYVRTRQDGLCDYS